MPAFRASALLSAVSVSARRDWEGSLVVFDSTRVLDARGLADGCVAAWDAFLNDQGLVYTSDDLSDDLPHTMEPRGPKEK